MTHFYRATLRIISAGFADYPSVYLSVTFVYCSQTAEDIVELLSRPCSPNLLVFLSLPVPLPNSKGPLAGALNYTGGEKS